MPTQRRRDLLRREKEAILRAEALRGGAARLVARRRAFNRRRIRGGNSYDYDKSLYKQGFFDDQTPEIRQRPDGQRVAPPPTWAELRAKADAMPDRSGGGRAAFALVGLVGIAAAGFAATR